MGTRTTVKITENGEIVASLYRHWDGYPAETGADLIEKAKAHTDGGHLVNALLEERETGDNTRKIYRIDPTAGDIEHYYIIALDWNEQTLIYHAVRPDWNTDVDEWISNPTRYTLREFCAIVNADREAMNKRLEELKRENYTAYKDSEPYPMVKV